MAEKKITHPLSPCLLLLALMFGALFLPVNAMAALERPVQVGIVFSPGDMLDVLTRTLAAEAEPLLGQPIILINKPGGGGMPGVAELARSAPDGYTLVSAVSNALILLPHRNKAPYKPLKDIEPVISFGMATPMLIVRQDSPYTSAEKFINATKKSGGALRIGVSGLGTPAHLALLIMTQNNPQLEWRFVPFAGAAEVETALLGGHIEAAASGDLARVKSGQFEPIMVLAGARSPALPDLPSLVDLGFPDPGQADSTFLILAPAGTPDETLNTLEQAFLTAAQSPTFLKAASGYSISPRATGRAQTRTMLRQSWARESEMLRKAGLVEHPATEPE